MHNQKRRHVRCCDLQLRSAMTKGVRLTSILSKQWDCILGGRKLTVLDEVLMRTCDHRCAAPKCTACGGKMQYGPGCSPAARCGLVVLWPSLKRRRTLSGPQLQEGGLGQAPGALSPCDRKVPRQPLQLGRIILLRGPCSNPP